MSRREWDGVLGDFPVFCSSGGLFLFVYWKYTSSLIGFSLIYRTQTPIYTSQSPSSIDHTLMPLFIGPFNTRKVTYLGISDIQKHLL